MVAAPLALAAVERGAVADRDEHVLQLRAARVVRVDVAGRDGRHAERLGELARAGVPAGVAALVRALQLDVERARGTRARAARRRSGRDARARGARSRRGRRARRRAPRATATVGAGGSGSRSLPGHARARVRGGEEPAEVRVAAAASRRAA